MQLKSTTGPYMLIAAGAVVLVTAILSAQLPVFGAAAVLAGLGVWALRDLDLSRFLDGPILMWAAAVLVGILALSSSNGALLLAALALAGLGVYARRGLRDAGPSRFVGGPILMGAAAVLVGILGVASSTSPLLLATLILAGLGYYAWANGEPGT
jgi:hypothetical protein